MSAINPSTSLEIQRRGREILALGATSFVDLAIIAPDLWRTFQDPGERRRVAEFLGWATTCKPDAFERMSLHDFVAVYLSSGVRSTEEAWLYHPNACEYLRRARCLDAVLQRIRRTPAEIYPVDVGFYVQRCLKFGDYECWRDCDAPAYQAAMGMGYLEDVFARTPHRPDAGYVTSGGNVTTTAQLIVARMLEIVHVVFTAGMIYRADRQKPGWRQYPIDFALSDFSTCIVIADGRLSGERRRIAWLRRISQKFRIIFLHSELLQGEGGLAAFYVHSRIRLSRAGILPVDLSLDPLGCLQPQCGGEPMGNGRGSR